MKLIRVVLYGVLWFFSLLVFSSAAGKGCEAKCEPAATAAIVSGVLAWLFSSAILIIYVFEMMGRFDLVEALRVAEIVANTVLAFIWMVCMIYVARRNFTPAFKAVATSGFLSMFIHIAQVIIVAFSLEDYL